jgi:hypothetical protein
MTSKRRRSKNEDEEREFWSKEDATEVVDWARAQRVTLAELKPSMKTISPRQPSGGEPGPK